MLVGALGIPQYSKERSESSQEEMKDTNTFYFLNENTLSWVGGGNYREMISRIYFQSELRKYS